MTAGTVPETKLGEHASPAATPELRAEFQTLLSGCGVYSLESRSKVVLTGDDRVRWLNGMITNNVRDLAVGHGVYAFVLNAQGRIQADLFAFQRGESLLVDCESSQCDKILKLFDHYIIADDVEVKDISEGLTAVGLTGPESRAALERAGVKVPELDYLQFAETTWQQIPCTVLRSGEEVKQSWQVWIDPAHVRELHESLVRAGAKPASAAALNLFRISRGIPQFGIDIRDRDLPQETGQQRALNFAKGCYLGQEIVERIRSRGLVHRNFAAFAVDGPLPEAGTKILADEKEAGEVTSSAVLPMPGGDRAVALGYVRREAAMKELRAGAARLKPIQNTIQ